MSKPWGTVGAWALDSEQAEAEEREEAAAKAAANPQIFPSLKEAAAAAAKPKKKKQHMSLSEFTVGTYVGPGGGRRDHSSSSSETKRLTHDEMLSLPTGPKERSAEELESGRGFRSYGTGGGGPRSGFSGGRKPDDGDGSWTGGRRPYGGGFDDEARRGPPQSRVSDFDQPSRADEVDNWGAGKKPFAPMDSGRHDRYSNLGSGSSARADDVDDWSLGKKPIQTRQSSFGSGFRDSSAPSDSDLWGRGGGRMPQNVDRERPRIVLDPPKGDVGAPIEPARTRPSPFGAARPREDILAEKGLDWRKIDSDIEIKKTSRPTSSQSSRPSSAQSSRPGSPGSQVTAAMEGAPKPRQKVNPFGDAKPREVQLQEQGKDWRKIDLELEHRSVDRPETEDEKLLKEEIDHLKKALTEETKGTSNDNSTHFSAEELTNIREQIHQRETDLEHLIRELDDKVRFSQRANSDIRPGSGAGRIAMSSDRPPSQSGMSEESRSMEFMERPRSRGGLGDAWAKPMDGRRGFQGGGERGFLGNRNMDRPKSRERW